MKMKAMYSLALMVAEDKRTSCEAKLYAQLKVWDEVKVACQSATSRFK